MARFILACFVTNGPLSGETKPRTLGGEETNDLMHQRMEQRGPARSRVAWWLGLALLGGCGGAESAESASAPEPVELRRGDPIETLDDDGPTFSHYLQSRVSGSTLLACTAVRGVVSFDISNPDDTIELGSTTFSLGDRCQYIHVDSDTGSAYVSHATEQINPQSFIARLDVSDPQHMREVWSLPLEEEPAGLAEADGLLVVTARADGLLIYDVSGDEPRMRGQLELPAATYVRLMDGVAVVANGAAGLTTVELGDGSVPAPLGEVALPGTAKDLVIAGDRAYVALGSGGLATVDISDLAVPELLDVDEVPGSAAALAVSPELGGLFVAAWNDLRAFDLTNPDDPLPLGRQALPRLGAASVRIMGVAASGAHVYGSNWDNLGTYRFVPGVGAPDVVMTPAIELVLPKVSAGERATAVVAVSNDGPLPVEQISVSVSGGLELTGVPERLEPFGRAAIEVTYHAQTDAPFEGTLTLQTDDIDEPTQSLALVANRPGLGVGDVVEEDWEYVDFEGNAIRLSQLSGPVLLAYFATF